MRTGERTAYSFISILKDAARRLKDNGVKIIPEKGAKLWY
jgi:hypothetical protein